MQLTKGTRFGDYEVIEPLAAGGMGEVYRARDCVLERPVALKILAADRSDPGMLARFEQEARLASSLNHPNIVTLHAVGRSGSTSYIVMEFVEGTTIAGLLTSGPLPIDRIFSIAIQVADGLARAHEAGIVHRDLKPQNIMVRPDGLVKILDFGLSKMMTPPDQAVTVAATSATAGVIMGTPGYMSPEQVQGRPLDFRTDQFSFGTILYEMITGTQPFFRETAIQTMSSVIDYGPAAVSERNPEVPTDLENIVTRCLKKSSAERYSSTRALADDLRGAYERFKTAPPGFPTRLKRRLYRRPRTFVFALASIAILALLVLFRQNLRFRDVAQVPQVPAMKRVAIVPFSAVNGDAATQTFADGLADSVTAKLVELEQFQSELQVIPTAEVRRESVQTAKAAREAFDATVAITGSLERSADAVRVALNVIDPAKMQQVRSRTIDVPNSELPDLPERVSVQIAEMLELSLQREGLQLLKSGGTKTSSALSEYIQGRGDLQRPEQAERVESAIGHFRHSVEMDPRYALAHAGLCEAYWRKFTLTKERAAVDEARKSCATALELDSRAATVHVTVATIHNGTGQFEEAAKSAQAALALDSLNAAAFRELATAYQNLNKMDEAEATFQRAIQMRPKDYSNYSVLGAFYYKIGKYSEAAAQFREVAQLTPDNYRAYSNLGGVYYLLKRYDEAIETLQHSLDLRPTGAAYSNLGTIYYGLEKYTEAAKAFEQAVKLNDRELKYWRNLAECYNVLQDSSDKARAAFLRTIELGEDQLRVNPRDPALLRDLATSYAMTGNKRKAVELLPKALAIAPNEVTFTFSAAQLYEYLGDREKALDLLAKALRGGLPLEQVDKDPHLASLRADPRFQALRER
jgi:serine/threonine protein kinase/tetratricopeptide (TPR) repeat protein